MSEFRTIDLLNMHNCQVKDERGYTLAILHEDEGVVVVKKTTACSLGDYMFILAYLRELGFEVR